MILGPGSWWDRMGVGRSDAYQDLQEDWKVWKSPSSHSHVAPVGSGGSKSRMRGKVAQGCITPSGYRKLL